MLSKYEKGLLATCYLNVCRAWKKTPGWIRDLALVAESMDTEFELKYSYPLSTAKGAASDSKKKKVKSRRHKLTKADIDKLEDYFLRVQKKYENVRETEEYVFLNNALENFGLEEIDRRICKLLLLSSRKGYEAFFEEFQSPSRPTMPEILAGFLGEQKKNIGDRLRFEEALLRTGLVYSATRGFEGDLIDDRLHYFLHPKLLDCIDRGEYDIELLMDRLIGKPVLPETEWEDFYHIGDEASYANRLIEGALASGAKGVNILIYGDTGTGKTEFCKVLSKRIGLPLYPIGTKEQEDSAPESYDSESPIEPGSAELRLANLRLVEHLLSCRGSRALTLFDEMEDLLGGMPMFFFAPRVSSFVMSKSATNNLLGQNQTPRLWTTNNIYRFDPALLRRFSLVVELKTPPADVRERIILRTLQRYGRELTQDNIRELAERHVLAPAFYKGAVETSSLAGQGNDEKTFMGDLNLALKNISRITGEESQLTAPRPVDNYDIALVNADQDLNLLAAKIVGGKHKRFSICGYGPSGTGKSEYLLYLAHKMQMDALLVPYSSVGSAYVSETERNIRMMFERAADEEKFLIFDEADSLLLERGRAQRSWEITIVNEMLTRMERHKGPFGCTTNLMEGIDTASLRRFTFKVIFKSLTREQSRRAFRLYFEQELPGEIVFPSSITPGDFANVKKQADVLDTVNNLAWLVEALERECAAKAKGLPSRPAGFGEISQAQKVRKPQDPA